MVSQGCLTPQEWQKDMEQMNAPANKDCTITHRVTDAKSISIDISCKTDNGMTSSGHWEMHMIDKEHGHGSGSMKGDAAGPNGQSFAVTMTMDTRYVSADCGDVKPGASKVIKQD